MAQPSIASYFTTRKRPANEPCVAKARKHLKLDRNEAEGDVPQRTRLVTRLQFEPCKSVVKKPGKDVRNQPNIQTILRQMQKRNADTKSDAQRCNERTPPTTPVKLPADEPSLSDIKLKLTRSSRLAELKASLSKFNKAAKALETIERKREETGPTSPALKTFQTIELEVQTSPSKVLHSPTKPYLSPKKSVSPCKNLFGVSSPPKASTSPLRAAAYQRFQSLASPGKPALPLPYKYRSLAEMFRGIDTVCAMLYNRKETITFAKLKPAVQDMMHRNLHLEHFRQLAGIFPDAFRFSWEKLRSFASVPRHDRHELVITPLVCDKTMTPGCLLARRRHLYDALLRKAKAYHEEFLSGLDPPMVVPSGDLKRWHPDFDIDKLPDVDEGELPPEPHDEVYSTGQEVLEKARALFQCNTRLASALKQFEHVEMKQEVDVKPMVAPVLKGIPKALLEKVRAKQAARALNAMTRSATEEKEALVYSRLPDIARLLRNTFVAEKKGVLPLDEIIIKLNHSYRSYLTNAEIEEHLRLLSNLVPGWIVFHEIRKTLFVKLSRDGDMSKVMKKLEELIKLKIC